MKTYKARRQLWEVLTLDAHTKPQHAEVVNGNGN